ncbi:MAG: LCP family protein [Oscillospiraceae bacterium]|nr:LCP family protein [Oscillospiraceae bacterium]
MRHHRRKTKIWVLLLFVIVLAAGFVGLSLWERAEDRKRTSDLTDPEIEKITLESDGVTYQLRDDITTYLIMGTDETLESEFRYEDKNLNNKQADFIMLMIADRTNEEYSLLHLNRDTYMEIRRLDSNGNPDGFVTAHLNNAHSFGSGGKDSCRNVAEAVSRLLCGVPVDHYYAVTMEAIPVLNDLVGGVTVHIEDDLTAMDPDFVQGRDVTLHGQQALRFVRIRTTVTDGTNINRMARQREYITALYDRLSAKLRASDRFAITLADTLDDYATSDLITDELAQLAERLDGYRFNGIETVPGETRMGEKYIEFYPDEEALRAQVIKLFFEPESTN